MPLEQSSRPELVPVPIDEARYPSLSGRTVLVSGGGSGIGMYLVEAFCRQGARVAFLDIDAAAAARVTRVIGEEHGNAPLPITVDLTDIDALRRAVESAREALGPISVLVNNAGNDDRRPLEEVTPEYWDERFATNLRHQLFAIQAVAPDMSDLGGGAVVNLGSNAWMQGAPGLIAYTTAKSGVQGLTRSLARELGGRRIRINSVAPGWILTERQVSRARSIYPDKFDSYLEKQCLEEFLLPPDVARLVLWLSADDSRMVTAQTFVVDGGVV